MMLTIALLLTLGQCSGTSCQAPARPAMVLSTPVASYAAQEPVYGPYAAGECSVQPESYQAHTRRFRPFAVLFAGRRGRCR